LSVYKKCGNAFGISPFSRSLSLTHPHIKRSHNTNATPHIHISPLTHLETFKHLLTPTKPRPSFSLRTFSRPPPPLSHNFSPPVMPRHTQRHTHTPFHSYTHLDTVKHLLTPPKSRSYFSLRTFSHFSSPPSLPSSPPTGKPGTCSTATTPAATSLKATSTSTPSSSGSPPSTSLPPSLPPSLLWSHGCYPKQEEEEGEGGREEVPLLLLLLGQGKH